jgi:hypothetical protein
MGGGWVKLQAISLPIPPLRAGVIQRAVHFGFGAKGEAGRHRRHGRAVGAEVIGGREAAVGRIYGDFRIARDGAFDTQAVGAGKQVFGDIASYQALTGADH